MSIYNKSILSLWAAITSLSTAMAMEQQPEAIDHLSALPDELKVEILSYLPASQIANVSNVNTHWNIIANDDALWKSFCVQANLEMSAKESDQTWEEFYKDELTPIPVRFSIQKPTQKIRDLSHFEINFMGHNFYLYEALNEDRLRKKDLVILTKDKVTKNYGCTYSAISQWIFPQNSPSGNGILHCRGLKDVSTTLPKKDQVLNQLHEAEAFVIILGQDYKNGKLGVKIKQEAPANPEQKLG